MGAIVRGVSTPIKGIDTTGQADPLGLTHIIKQQRQRLARLNTSDIGP